MGAIADTGIGKKLFYKSDSERIPIQNSAICLDGRNDDKYQLRDQKRNKYWDANQQKDKQSCYKNIYGKGNLEIDHFLAMFIHHRELVFLHRPDYDGSNQISERYDISAQSR
jgi:hypothetical protein